MTDGWTLFEGALIHYFLEQDGHLVQGASSRGHVIEALLYTAAKKLCSYDLLWLFIQKTQQL